MQAWQPPRGRAWLVQPCTGLTRRTAVRPAQLEQRGIQRVRIPGQPVNHPRRTGHLVPTPFYDPRRNPGYDMRGSQHQPPAQPESRPIPIPLSPTASEGASISTTCSRSGTMGNPTASPRAELSPCVGPTPAPP